MLNEDESLTELLSRLLLQGKLPRSESSFDTTSLRALGLSVDATHIGLPADVQPLSESLIRAELTTVAVEWLKEMQIFPTIGSTNRWLMELLESGQVVDGYAVLAELQTAGRGRRGRGWHTPFARNLAITLGFQVHRPIAEMGGLSLAVGIGVVRALRSMISTDIGLKWPNDVLANGKKLGGILVELGHAATTNVGTTAVVGMGLNLALEDVVVTQIDQPVTDLQRLAGQSVHRNRVAAHVISQVVAVIGEFMRDGFSNLQAEFDQYHILHGRPSTIHLGEKQVHGVVTGTDLQGGLILATDAGRQTFHAGESSLRAAQM